MFIKLLLSGFLFLLTTTWVNSTGTGCQFGVDSAKKTAKSVNEFSLQLYKKIIASKPDENIVFSPVSIALALALVENGAGGDTQAALKRVLSSSDQNSDDISTFYQSLQHQLQIRDSEAKLIIANGLFYDQKYNLKNEYLTKAKQCFETEIERVNFREKEAARQKINSWVANMTAQKIPNLLQPGLINANLTKVILANAILLKATWLEKFESKENLPFYRFGRANDAQTVPFVRRLDRYTYMDDPDFHAVQIPYSDDRGELSMRIILPKQKDGIQIVEQKLTESKFRSMMANTTERPKIDLKFPKFTIRTPTKLKQILQGLGLEKIFADDADFSRMTTGPFHVSDVVHEAYIKVNENGTEAAAATAVVMGVPLSLQVGPTPAPISFIADHPFIFAIVHKPTESVIFMGKVNFIKENEN